MSWLLVAFIPGLLMLATFGLGRLESGLELSANLPDDVTAMLEQAKADSLRRPLAIRAAPPPGVLPLRTARPDWWGTTEAASTLPTRTYVHHRANPQFPATRQPDRV